ncbi:hypothetical protein GBL_2322 [Geobacillus kaustophilus GBlys]|uniref:Uncharacterized protein n=1 Tax=Geobacillus kaustophilus GBlys TaxID=1337888 RepID=U2X5C1_GEOKU|nr:hypothetical protein GBL_2322 [Geobacillus kaustophilus GBlys]
MPAKMTIAPNPLTTVSIILSIAVNLSILSASVFFVLLVHMYGGD